MEDYYTLLGVPKDATSEQLKIAYRDLVIKWHPDKHMDKSESERKVIEEHFKKINEAYAVLSNSVKRGEYDSYGNVKFHEKYTTEDIVKDFDYSKVVFDLFSNIETFVATKGNSQVAKDIRAKAAINAIVEGGLLLFIYLCSRKGKGE
jgi:DnaJ-class molecular chaperone